jgi:hypothetical protein
MVDIEAYITELTEDTKVTAFDIKEVQMKLPATKHKWTGRFIRHKQQLLKLQKQRDDTKKNLVKDIIAKSVVKITDAVADRAVETSDSIKQLDEELQNLKLTIELIEKADKILSSMTYDVGNMIKLMQLEQQ